jgi:phage baseplate assembly protein W
MPAPTTIYPQTKKPAPTFIGIAFPFQKGSTQFPAQATDDDLIRQALIQLILTQKNTRVMRPSYGTDAWKFVFENNNLALTALIQTEVGQSIAKNETRVVLLGVNVSKDANGNVICIIQYFIPATSKKQTLSMNMSTGQVISPSGGGAGV